MRPIAGNQYTLEEIENQLDLLDSPCLEFTHQNIDGCIQTAHLTSKELLAILGLSSTYWQYRFTTSEWIPVFQYVSTEPITEFIELEKYYDYDGIPQWWATPLGHPRKCEVA